MKVFKILIFCVVCFYCGFEVALLFSERQSVVIDTLEFPIKRIDGKTNLFFEKSAVIEKVNSLIEAENQEIENFSFVGEMFIDFNYGNGNFYENRPRITATLILGLGSRWSFFPFLVPEMFSSYRQERLYSLLARIFDLVEEEIELSSNKDYQKEIENPTIDPRKLEFFFASKITERDYAFIKNMKESDRCELKIALLQGISRYIDPGRVRYPGYILRDIEENLSFLKKDSCPHVRNLAETVIDSYLKN